MKKKQKEKYKKKWEKERKEKRRNEKRNKRIKLNCRKKRREEKQNKRKKSTHEIKNKKSHQKATGSEMKGATRRSLSPSRSQISTTAPIFFYPITKQGFNRALVETTTLFVHPRSATPGQASLRDENEVPSTHPNEPVPATTLILIRVPRSEQQSRRARIRRSSWSRNVHAGSAESNETRAFRDLFMSGNEIYSPFIDCSSRSTLIKTQPIIVAYP